MAQLLTRRMASLAISRSHIISMAPAPRRNICFTSFTKSPVNALKSSTKSTGNEKVVGNYNYLAILDLATNNSCTSRHSLSTISSPQSAPKSSSSETKQDPRGTIMARDPSGKLYAIPPKPMGKFKKLRHAPKLAPSIKSARVSKLRTVSNHLRNVRHSPWRLNLICQFIAGQTVPEAMTQLRFSEKGKAPDVSKLLHQTATKAKIMHGLEPSELEVVECFATHATHLKRIKFMGRGRAGRKLRRFSHARLVLREIDFPLKIVECATVGERKRWLKRMELAVDDRERNEKEREEIEELERQVEEMKRKKEDEDGAKS